MSLAAVEVAIAAARDHHLDGQLERAEAICGQILAVYPRRGDALYLLGLIHYQANRPEKAIEAFQRASAECPQSADIFCNLGVALQKIGRIDEAIVAYRHALTLNPTFAEGFNNLGLALSEKGLIPDAIVSYRRALAIKPDYPAAHYNLGLALLMQGDLENGWPEHEWRLKVDELALFRPQCAQPRWQGEDLKGKKILIYDEQGAGDAIQFVRYLPYVSDRGGKVILGCHPGLLRLMKTARGVSKCVVRPADVGEFDVHCSLMSLPHAFSTTLNNIPAHESYLQVDPSQADLWKRRIDDRPSTSPARLKIGIAWAGRPQHPNDHNRSLPLAVLGPLCELKDVEFFSLQKGEAAKQASNPPPGMKLHNWADELHDFADTAALVRNLDLVITIDTSIAHLAGAMGKPVWVLLPFVPDWRWFRGRDDSPWYPSMMLFRQPTAGDWQTPLQRMAQMLQTFKPASQQA